MGGFEGNLRSIELSVGASSVSCQMVASSIAPLCDFTYVLVDGDTGEPCPEHVPPVGVDLAEESVPPSGPPQAFVESADPGKERARDIAQHMPPFAPESSGPNSRSCASMPSLMSTRVLRTAASLSSTSAATSFVHP